MKKMKKLFACFICAMVFTFSGATVVAEEVKIGVLFGFTGPLESFTGSMASAVELAVKEVSSSGVFLKGSTVTSVRADTTCLDVGAAIASADRLISTEKVNAIVGALCSGSSTAVLQNVAMPKGIVMISPGSTSPALSIIEDNDLFFRVVPSDARQGEVIAKVMVNHGVKEAALTYTNNDYGKGLSESISRNFKSLGGKITINSDHEDGKGDYSAEIATLAAAGGDVLIVAGYADQGGKGIIQGALDVDAFETFVLLDSMISERLVKIIGDGLNGSYGIVTGNEGSGTEIFAKMAAEAGFKIGTYTPEAYDATALILLAMQAAKSSKSNDFKGKIMSVANAPGEKIFPSQLKQGLEILANGGEIDYVGATAVELIGSGESAGNFREILIKDGKIISVDYH